MTNHESHESEDRSLRGNLIRPSVLIAQRGLVPPLYESDKEAPRYTLFFNVETKQLGYKDGAGTVHRPTADATESSTDHLKEQRFDKSFSVPLEDSNLDQYGNVTPGLLQLSQEPPVEGTKYYIHNSGDDTNGAGTYNDPCKTFEPFAEGNRLALSSGDAIVVKEGGSVFPENVGRLLLGTGGISIMGEQGTFPTVDCTSWTADQELIMSYSYGDVTVRGVRLLADGSGATAEGIKFDNMAAGNDTVEQAKGAGYIFNTRLEGWGGPGVGWFGTSVGGVCEHVVSYGNYGGDGNADGIQHTGSSGETAGGGYTLFSVMAHNGDDGLDLFRCTGHVALNSVCIWNGYRPDGTPSGTAPGAGFKLGGTDATTPTGGNIAKGCISYGNGAAGYTHNGANRPNDFINIVGWFNARKDSRDYEKDVQIYEDSTDAEGDKCRVINAILEQGVYTSLQSGVWDSTNVIECNMDSDNNFSLPFSEVPWLSIARDAAGYPDDPRAFGRLSDEFDSTSHPTIYFSGSSSYEPTPANQYHGADDPVQHSGTEPDLGAYQTEP